MVEQSAFVCGSTGTGKSEREKVVFNQIADAGDCALVCLDGKGTLAFGAAGQLVAGGHERRVEYEWLASPDGKCLPWDFLPEPEPTGAFQRAVAEDVIREEFKQVFLARKGLLSDEDKGFTKDWLDFAVTVMQRQVPRKPVSWIGRCFEPTSWQFNQLKEHCSDPELVRRMEEVAVLARKQGSQFRTESGAARRMLSDVTSATFAARCTPPPGGAFDWLTALEQKKLILVSGAGVSRAAVSRAAGRLVFLAIALQVTNACRRYHAKHRKPLRVVLILEECGAYGLAAAFILVALQELREAGFACRILTQSTLDFDEPTLEKILTNTPGGHYWFQLLSDKDQERAARDLTNTCFDPLAVHFTRERKQVARHREIESTSRGESRSFDVISGKLANAVRQDERTGIHYLPEYETVIEPTYKTAALQDQEFRTRIANHVAGEYRLRTPTGVLHVRGRMLEPAWPMDLTEKRTLEAIERIRSRGHYRTAALHSPAFPGSEVPSTTGDASSFLD